MSLIDRLHAALSAPAASPHGDWDFRDGTDRPDAFTPAAVLIPIIDRAEPTVLLTRRTDTLRRHAGQVAFPGGRIDAEDASPVAAALREAHEEVALCPEDVRVLGISDDYETGTGYRITPVVGVVPPDLPLVPCEAEVASVFEVPLAHLLDPAAHELRSAFWRGRDRQFYAIVWESHEIWGATAGMIVNLSRKLAA